MNKIITIFGLILLTACSASKSHRDASRESIGLATPAAEQKEAIFQIYIARAFSWRGHFATHPWVAWKRPDDSSYTIAQVVGWRTRRGLPAVEVRQDLPDRRWFDSPPQLIDEHRGEVALRIIDHVEELIKTYPYTETYTLWPGPNSNTFVAYLIRNTSELIVELPPHSIGKDYLGKTEFLALSPSKTGVQFSTWGLFGLTLGAREGVELNLLSLSFGVDFWPPALKLPFVGRVGFPNKVVPIKESSDE